VLAGDFFAADPAVGPAGTGEEKPEVVVDLGRSRHRRAGIVAGVSLLDRDRRRQARNLGNRRFLHLFEELPGVGAQRFDVFPASLGVDRIERQRTLARAAYAGNHNHLIPRDAEADILEIMLGGTGYFDRFVCIPSHPVFLLLPFTK